MGHVARMGEMRSAQCFGWKTGRKRPPGSPGRRWEDNVRTYLRAIGWKGVD
jgi:hypothetical protein